MLADSHEIEHSNLPVCPPQVGCECEVCSIQPGLANLSPGFVGRNDEASRTRWQGGPTESDFDF